jgi:hypothetical protein
LIPIFKNILALYKDMGYFSYIPYPPMEGIDIVPSIGRAKYEWESLLLFHLYSLPPLWKA